MRAKLIFLYAALCRSGVSHLYAGCLKKKRKNICSNIKAVKKVNKPTEIFATRFQPDITESDIKSYITNEFSDAESISIEKLKTKYNTYSSFKISIIGISLKDALNEESWPEDIFVKRFYAPKMESTASAVNTSDQNIQS